MNQEDVMEAEEYVALCIMRDRLAEARKRAEFAAALYRQSSGRSPHAKGVGRRLLELAGALVKGRGRGATALAASRRA
jgi:hypothetical protein